MDDTRTSNTAAEAAGAEVNPQSGPQAGQTCEPESARALRQAEDQLRRALADLDNYRKRFDRELHRLRVQEREGVLRDLLPVADNLERALASTEGDSWRTGVEAVYRQLLDVLRRHGVEPVEDQGQPFNPEWHEVVSTRPADADEGTILDVAERGYKVGDRPLRHARVVVAKD